MLEVLILFFFCRRKGEYEVVSMGWSSNVGFSRLIFFFLESFKVTTGLVLVRGVPPQKKNTPCQNYSQGWGGGGSFEEIHTPAPYEKPKPTTKRPPNKTPRFFSQPPPFLPTTHPDCFPILFFFFVKN